MVELGKAKEIDREITEFKKNIYNTWNKKDLNFIKNSKIIYELVFKPLKNELGTVKRIFISPAGNLNLIPFEILLGPDKQYLIEKYT